MAARIAGSRRPTGWRPTTASGPASPSRATRRGRAQLDRRGFGYHRAGDSERLGTRPSRLAEDDGGGSGSGVAVRNLAVQV